MTGLGFTLGSSGLPVRGHQMLVQIQYPWTSYQTLQILFGKEPKSTTQKKARKHF